MSVLRFVLFVAIVRPFLAIVAGSRVWHRQRLPTTGPAIIVANHNSNLDTLALMALLPLASFARVRAVAAADYLRRHPLLTWIAKALRVVLVERKQPQCSRRFIEECDAILADGQILILFPEGTRGAPGRMAPLKNGIAHLARRHPHVPITPVFLRGFERVLPKGAHLPVPHFCEAHVGAPCKWSGDLAGFMESLEAAFADLAEAAEHLRRQNRLVGANAGGAPLKGA